MSVKFEREKHVYLLESFEEIIRDVIRFFNGTPVHTLPLSVRFKGAGVYAMYYSGKHPYYRKLYKGNRLEANGPIYIGKAVPAGWRQAKSLTSNSTFELFKRLNEHCKSINQVQNLHIADFTCRFIILESESASLVSAVEAALIRHYQPIWNTVVDGFGNHDPGSGRYNQAKSDWDVVHPGRPWADKCTGNASTVEIIEKEISTFATRRK